MTASVLDFPRTFEPITLPRLAAIVGRARVDLSVEVMAQAEMAVHLRRVLDPSITVAREVRLSPADRPDFLVDGRFVIEMKLGKAASLATWRQLKRYADHDVVQGIILAGSRGLGGDMAERLGKPFIHVSLGRAWL